MKLILNLLILLALLGCNNTKSELKSLKKEYDLNEFHLKKGFNFYVSRTFLKEEKIECGRIDFIDGDYAEYWFRSHHVTNDNGWTLFEFSNGTEKLMEGWFCCEVQLPKEQLKNKGELLTFIKEHDGISP